ncbi:MAG TPA: hypothetical protein DCY07_08655 [Rhodospirillaceae bacterium]|nr:hypothetical protein [Rhodospirillaceae bacterium]
MDHTIEKRLQVIEERNKKVEFDKAWETSWTRRLVILGVTYVVVALVLTRIHPEGAWVDAIIPCFGYILSTLSLPPIKAFWIKWKTKRRK